MTDPAPASGPAALLAALDADQRRALGEACAPPPRPRSRFRMPRLDPSERSSAYATRPKRTTP